MGWERQRKFDLSLEVLPEDAVVEGSEDNVVKGSENDMVTGVYKCKLPKKRFNPVKKPLTGERYVLFVRANSNENESDNDGDDDINDGNGNGNGNGDGDGDGGDGGDSDGDGDGDGDGEKVDLRKYNTKKATLIMYRMLTDLKTQQGKEVFHTHLATLLTMMLLCVYTSPMNDADLCAYEAYVRTLHALWCKLRFQPYTTEYDEDIFNLKIHLMYQIQYNGCIGPTKNNSVRHCGNYVLGIREFAASLEGSEMVAFARGIFSTIQELVIPQTDPKAVSDCVTTLGTKLMTWELGGQSIKPAALGPCITDFYNCVEPLLARYAYKTYSWRVLCEDISVDNIHFIDTLPAYVPAPTFNYDDDALIWVGSVIDTMKYNVISAPHKDNLYKLITLYIISTMFESTDFDIVTEYDRKHYMDTLQEIDVTLERDDTGNRIQTAMDDLSVQFNRNRHNTETPLCRGYDNQRVCRYTQRVYELYYDYMATVLIEGITECDTSEQGLCNAKSILQVLDKVVFQQMSITVPSALNDMRFFCQKFLEGEHANVTLRGMAVHVCTQMASLLYWLARKRCVWTLDVSAATIPNAPTPTETTPTCDAVAVIPPYVKSLQAMTFLLRALGDCLSYLPEHNTSAHFFWSQLQNAEEALNDTVLSKTRCTTLFTTLLDVAELLVVQIAHGIKPKQYDTAFLLTQDQSNKTVETYTQLLSSLSGSDVHTQYKYVLHGTLQVVTLLCRHAPAVVPDMDWDAHRAAYTTYVTTTVDSTPLKQSVEALVYKIRCEQIFWSETMQNQSYVQKIQYGNPKIQRTGLFEAGIMHVLVYTLDFFRFGDVCERICMEKDWGVYLHTLTETFEDRQNIGASVASAIHISLDNMVEQFSSQTDYNKAPYLVKDIVQTERVSSIAARMISYSMYPECAYGILHAIRMITTRSNISLFKNTHWNEHLLKTSWVEEMVEGITDCAYTFISVIRAFFEVLENANLHWDRECPMREKESTKMYTPIMELFDTRTTAPKVFSVDTRYLLTHLNALNYTLALPFNFIEETETATSMLSYRQRGMAVFMLWVARHVRVPTNICWDSLDTYVAWLHLLHADASQDTIQQHLSKFQSALEFCKDWMIHNPLMYVSSVYKYATECVRSMESKWESFTTVTHRPLVHNPAVIAYMLGVMDVVQSISENTEAVHAKLEACLQTGTLTHECYIDFRRILHNTFAHLCYTLPVLGASHTVHVFIQDGFLPVNSARIPVSVSQATRPSQHIRTVHYLNIDESISRNIFSGNRVKTLLLFMPWDINVSILALQQHGPDISTKKCRHLASLMAIRCMLLMLHDTQSKMWHFFDVMLRTVMTDDMDDTGILKSTTLLGAVVTKVLDECIRKPTQHKVVAEYERRVLKMMCNTLTRSVVRLYRPHRQQIFFGSFVATMDFILSTIRQHHPTMKRFGPMNTAEEHALRESTHNVNTYMYNVLYSIVEKGWMWGH